MNCTRAQKLLSADYLDNELSAPARAEVDRHLAQCVACRGYLSVARDAMAPLRGSSRPVLSDEARARIYRAAQVAAPAHAIFFVPVRWRVALSSLAAAAAIAVVIATAQWRAVDRERTNALFAHEYQPVLSSAVVDADSESSPEFGFNSTVEEFVLG